MLLRKSTKLVSSFTRTWTTSTRCNHPRMSSNSTTLKSSLSAASSSTHSLVVPSKNTLDEAVQDLEAILTTYPLLNDDKSNWRRRIQDAKKLMYQQQRETISRIAIIGDHYSGIDDLISSLFDRVLSDKDQVGNTLNGLALKSRHLALDENEVLFIKHGQDSFDASTPSNEIRIDSDWLNKMKIEVVEIIHGELAPKKSSIDTLFSSDIVILNLSEEQASLIPQSTRTILEHVSGKPNLILTLNSTETSSSLALRTLSRQLSSSAPPIHDLLPISTEKANQALKALHEANAFDRFQSLFLQSGIPKLKDSIDSILTLNDRSALSLQSVHFMVKKMVESLAIEGAKIDDALHKVETDLAALEFIIHEATSSILNSLNVDEFKGLRIPPQDLETSMKVLRDCFSKELNWYQLPWKTDELVSQIALVISASFLVQFEQHLIYSTGTLQALSSTLSSKTDELLSTKALLPPSQSTISSPLESIYSSIILNEIKKSETESKIDSNTSILIEPLHHRRNQITSRGGPAEFLQSKAQQIVLSTTSFSSVSILLGLGIDFWQYTTSTGTAIGMSALGILLGFKYAQSSWERAKNKFLKDVEGRIKDGLEEDLGVAVNRLLERCTYKARTTVALGKHALYDRRKTFTAFRRDLTEVDRRLRDDR